MLVTTDQLDVTQVALAMIVAIPGFITSAVAAWMTIHNRIIAKDTNATAKETKNLVNGRMDELLSTARALAQTRNDNDADKSARIIAALTARLTAGGKDDRRPT